jgi:energy-coupling factor transporter ATP-binding protein EcfA2
VKQFELENLVFRRNARFTLEIDELFLENGEKVAVVGPNGSGKTTLLRLLSFLEQPDSWTRFLFRGQPYAPGRMDRKGLGFLKERPFLFRGSVAENLAYPLKLRRLRPPEIEARVDAMLARMELEQLAGARAHHLSAGEQRRLALGRVLIAGPEMLLLDEPVAHLDARSRAVIEDVLVAAEGNVLLTTHDVHFAHRVAGRVLNLKAGRVSAGLSVNIIEGRVEEGCLVTEQGSMIALPETAVPTPYGSLTVILNPRALTVSLEPPAPGTPNLLRGRVASIRGQGDEVWLEVDCGHRLTAIVSRKAYEEEGLNLHREVLVAFGADAVEMV